MSFSGSNQNLEKRKHPVLRVMTVGDLLDFVRAYHTQTGNTTLVSTFTDIIGGGNSWRDLEIKFGLLTKKNQLPKIKTYRPPEGFEKYLVLPSSQK